MIMKCKRKKVKLEFKMPCLVNCEEYKENQVYIMIINYLIVFIYILIFFVLLYKIKMKRNKSKKVCEKMFILRVI